MHFELQVAKKLYDSEEDADYKLIRGLGYGFIKQPNGQWKLWEQPTHGVELASMEELVEFTKKYGDIVINGKTVTIYNGPLEA